MDHWATSLVNVLQQVTFPPLSTQNFVGFLFGQVMSNPFEKPALDLANLVHKKNTAYGDSIRSSVTLLGELWPDGIPVSSYKDLLLLVRMFDKMKRIATNNDPSGENPYQDICGYALRGVVQNADNNRAKVRPKVHLSVGRKRR
jgi:hypothetical protein